MNMGKERSLSASIRVAQVFRIVICVFLCLLSLFPFWVMLVNATRTSVEIQTHFSLIPSVSFLENYTKLIKQCNENVPLWRYMVNSLIIAVSSTALTVYFSTMTAYGVTIYKFKGASFVWAFIMGIMMIPAQVSSIGFFRFIYKIGLGNSYIPLILPAIAAPATVFFMRQYMISALPKEIIDAARIDGSGEFRTFNTIAVPLMKPAIATQCIFAFIGSWNNFYTPSMLLTSQSKYTLPMFVQIMRGERFRTDFGIIYVGLVITIAPIFIVYCLLSKYIIAGVALGGVKE
ncbi:MAG: carbohydrate ABC transporter permease [Lachnospiraceae bacterium]